MSRKKKVYEDQSFSIEKISVGYDKLLETLSKVAKEETSVMWYPPYNIRKNGKEYIIDLDVAGYNKEDIKAVYDNGALTISAPGVDKFVDPEGDDVYYHQGIYPGGDLLVKFYVADNVKFDSATWDDGILKFVFLDVTGNTTPLNIPIGPFKNENEGKPFVPEYNSSGEVVGKKDIVTGEVTSVVVADAPSVLPPLFDRDQEVVVVNEDNKKEPTVEVALPNPLPQIVEVTSVDVVDKVDTKSEEPQVSVVVSDATGEIKSDDVVTEVVKTEEGKSDIVVAIPTELHEELTNAGVDVPAVLADAVEKSNVDLPPATAEEIKNVDTSEVKTEDNVVTVVVPDVLPQVVEATVENNKVVLTDTSENIPEDATLVPVVTSNGQGDIVVAVTPETQEKLDDLGVDVAKDISDVLVKEETPVVSAETSVATDVAPPLPPEVVTEPTTVVVNGESDTQPTVEVTLPDPLPQIVEVTKADVVDKVDVKSEDPQATVVLEPATVEVKSDDVVTEVVKTEDGKSDVVVVVPADMHEDLTNAGVDIPAVLADAISQANLNPPEAPVVPENVETTVTPVTTDSGSTVLVETPDVMPQVVEATVESQPTEYNSAGSVVKEEPVVVLTDVSKDVPADATLVPVVTGDGQNDVVVAVTPETQEKLDKLGVDVATDVSTALVKNETEVVPAEVVPASSEPSVEAETKTVVLNADDTSKPTVEVVLPDPLPQIAEVSVEKKVDTVDPASSEPQVTVVVSDATHEVSDNVVTDVVKTEDGSADTVVAVPAEVHEEMTNVGVDVLDSVKEAVSEAQPEPAALPPAEELVKADETLVSVVDEKTEEPKLEVTVPETIPQVVQAVVTESTDENIPAIKLENVTEDVPANAELIPVVTGEGQPDIMVAVTPEVKATLEAANVDVATDVSKALVEANVDVVKSEEVTQ